ncbi:hypothetical protein NL676_011872 [Syzygium grande]|nr:hypothetical protein NL676_011872 [Syzygium grande]
MGGGAVHPPPPKAPSPPGIFLPSPSPSPSGRVRGNDLPVSASHGEPPPCSASGCASPGKVAAATTLGSAVLGLLPSELEIEKAIRALLDLWQSASSSGSEQYWMQLLGCRDSSILMSSGWGRVRHALHLLQTEPAIKKLVISVVLDKAFWSAIMNNQSVQQFQEKLLSDETESPQICEEVNWGTNDLQWLLDILKDKIMELIEKFKLLLIKALQLSQPPTPEATAELEENIRSSLLLSVLIILIVVLARLARGKCVAAALNLSDPFSLDTSPQMKRGVKKLPTA